VAVWRWWRVQFWEQLDTGWGLEGSYISTQRYRRLPNSTDLHLELVPSLYLRQRKTPERLAFTFDFNFHSYRCRRRAAAYDHDCGVP